MNRPNPTDPDHLRMSPFLRAFFSRRVAFQACKVASVVSPTLLLLNHPDLLLTQPFSFTVLRKLALNFAVPYLVSSYSAARTAVVDATSRAAEPNPVDD